MAAQEKFKDFETALSKLVKDYFGSRIHGVLKDSISISVGNAKIDPSWQQPTSVRDIDIHMVIVGFEEDVKHIFENNEPFSIEKYF